MRQLLLMSLLVLGAGCQGLHDRTDCRRGYCTTTDQCQAPEKKGPADLKSQPKQDAVDPGRAPTIAQDVLLVPVTSYIPYARQTPVGPVRMVMGPQDITDRRGPADERINPPADEKVVRKLMDLCEKQCERIDQLERCIKERNVCPPTVICPPTTPTCPPTLFRRPLFPRCEPLFQRCEPLPTCDTPAEAPTQLQQRPTDLPQHAKAP